MEFDINYSFCYHTTNANVIGMYWKTYGHGLWYDTRKETYEQALERIKEIIWNNIYAEFPHLKGAEINYTESELPTIQNKKEMVHPFVFGQENIDEKLLPQTTEQKILALIDSATTIKDMELYRKSVANNSKKYPALQIAFDNKLKSLK